MIGQLNQIRQAWIFGGTAVPREATGKSDFAATLSAFLSVSPPEPVASGAEKTGMNSGAESSAGKSGASLSEDLVCSELSGSPVTAGDTEESANASDIVAFMVIPRTDTTEGAAYGVEIRAHASSGELMNSDTPADGTESAYLPVEFRISLPAAESATGAETVVRIAGRIEGGALTGEETESPGPLLVLSPDMDEPAQVEAIRLLFGDGGELADFSSAISDATLASDISGMTEPAKPSVSVFRTTLIVGGDPAQMMNPVRGEETLAVPVANTGANTGRPVSVGTFETSTRTAGQRAPLFASGSESMRTEYGANDGPGMAVLSGKSNTAVFPNRNGMAPVRENVPAVLPEASGTDTTGTPVEAKATVTLSSPEQPEAPSTGITDSPDSSRIPVQTGRHTGNLLELMNRMTEKGETVSLTVEIHPFQAESLTGSIPAPSELNPLPESAGQRDPGSSGEPSGTVSGHGTESQKWAHFPEESAISSDSSKISRQLVSRSPLQMGAAVPDAVVDPVAVKPDAVTDGEARLTMRNNDFSPEFDVSVPDSVSSSPESNTALKTEAASVAPGTPIAVNKPAAEYAGHKPEQRVFGATGEGDGQSLRLGTPNGSAAKMTDMSEDTPQAERIGLTAKGNEGTIEPSFPPETAQLAEPAREGVTEAVSGEFPAQSAKETVGVATVRIERTSRGGAIVPENSETPPARETARANVPESRSSANTVGNTGIMESGEEMSVETNTPETDRMFNNRASGHPADRKPDLTGDAEPVLPDAFPEPANADLEHAIEGFSAPEENELPFSKTAEPYHRIIRFQTAGAGGRESDVSRVDYGVGELKSTAASPAGEAQSDRATEESLISGNKPVSGEVKPDSSVPASMQPSRKTVENAGSIQDFGSAVNTAPDNTPSPGSVSVTGPDSGEQPKSGAGDVSSLPDPSVILEGDMETALESPSAKAVASEPPARSRRAEYHGPDTAAVDPGEPIIPERSGFVMSASEPDGDLAREGRRGSRSRGRMENGGELSAPVLNGIGKSSGNTGEFGLSSAGMGQTVETGMQTHGTGPLPGTERVIGEGTGTAGEAESPDAAPVSGYIGDRNSQTVEAARSGKTSAFRRAYHTATYESNILDTIVRQARVLSGNGQSSATVVLDPPSLGRLKLEIATENSKVTGTIIVESKEVQDIVRNNLSELRQSFSQNGLQVESFDVQVGHNGGSDAWAQRENLESTASMLRSTRDRSPGDSSTATVERKSRGRPAKTGILDVWM